MKKIISILSLTAIILIPGIVHADGRPTDYTGPNYENLPSHPNMCYENGVLVYCDANVKTKAKKHKDIGKMVLVSVAVGAVFAGGMWYFFKKKPSENNPGQVTLMEF